MSKKALRAVCFAVSCLFIHFAGVLADSPLFTKARLDLEDRLELNDIEKATFRGFEKTLDKKSGLPVEMVPVIQGSAVRLPGNAYYDKTSPAKIGLAFLYPVLARDRGLMTPEAAYQRVWSMIETVENLESCEGFLYNWYYLPENGRSPKRAVESYVSSFENGVLDAALMAAAGAFAGTPFEKRVEKFLARHDYHFFFDKNPFHPGTGLLNQAYDDARKKYSGEDYGILNTEGRLPALIAVLKDGVPESAWKSQGRVARSYENLDHDKIPVVASWAGSAFEALFPDEFIGGSKLAPAAFRENAVNTLRVHIDRGRRLSPSGIWGFSHGTAPDGNVYRPAGVAAIAYSPQPAPFAAAYPSFLALRYAAKAGVLNLRKMRELNPKVYSARFGFVDSIDPSTGAVSRNLLSLNKGIEMLCIGNLLNRLTGKKEIPDYFIDYLAKRGWRERARSLLKAEEREPAFQTLVRPGAPDNPYQPLNAVPVDVMQVRHSIGTFFDPKRGKTSYRLLDEDTNGPVVEMEYEMPRRGTYSGLYFKFDEMDLAPYQEFTFEVKGNSRTGFPKTLQVELKSEGRHVQFEIIRVQPDWSQVRVPIPDGTGPVDELCFVLENREISGSQRGGLYLRSMLFQ